MKILLLGSNHPNTATAHQSFGLPKSILVNSVQQDFHVGHTARQEFDSDSELEIVLSSADRVYWTFPCQTEFTDEKEYHDFLKWLKAYNDHHGNICNFHDIYVDPYQWSQPLPRISNQDAIFFGCSFTEGVGIPNKENRWANLVAKHFGKNCVNLGVRGSSNQYVFDCISNLQFTAGQIVVWQLPNLDRIYYCNEDRTLQHIMLTSATHAKHRSMIDVLTLEHMMYDLRCKVNMVVKLCRAIGARFVFWPVDYKEHSTFSDKDLMNFFHLPEFIPAYKLQEYLVDAGTDGIHPGIESNKNIAKSVIEHIESLYQ